MFTLCSLLSRLKFKLDILKMQRKILLQTCQNIYETDKVEKSFLTRFLLPPHLTHNIMNQNFDKSALIYKIISQNSKLIPVLFQLSHISKYF